MAEPMDRRIAQLALARFRVGGYVGTSIADLAGALGVSKAAIYHLYRSKDALLHHLVDPLLDAIDACIGVHHQPTRAGQQLLGAYLAVLLAHRDVVPLVATDVAVLNHPTIGPRLRAQNHQLQSFLTGPDTNTSARLHAEAVLGAIWRPLIAEPRSTLPTPPTSTPSSTPPSPPSNPADPPPTRNPYRLPTPAGTPSTSSERCRSNIAGR
jgi:AcrR family transcriptional regulator